MKFYFFFLLTGLFSNQLFGQNPSETFHLKAGDLLFQDLDCGPFCEAVEKVTFGVDGAKFSHIGLVVPDDSTGQLVVLEAVSAGVIETRLDSFLLRSLDGDGHPKVLVGRLRPEKAHLNKAAIAEAKKLRGKPYDDIFDIDNDAYYCSEMIYWSYKKANAGQPVFQLQPMTYIDPETGKTFEIWTDYFKNLNHPVPEGQPGLNPGGMSRSPYIQIVHAFGQPAGWRPNRRP
ncbi:MAG: hypothetical protein D6714_15180 [Bacteroidetes bacterium]|nr:MAG: hypothetical protein D6714_15180 [Bacteroidota bacterium]